MSNGELAALITLLPSVRLRSDGVGHVADMSAFAPQECLAGSPAGVSKRALRSAYASAAPTATADSLREDPERRLVSQKFRELEPNGQLVAAG